MVTVRQSTDAQLRPGQCYAASVHDIARELLELSTEAMGSVRGGVITEINSAASRLGFEVGQPLIDTVAPEGIEAFQGARSGGSAITRTLGLRAAWVEWRFRSMQDRLLFCATDITPRVQTEEQLETLLVEIRRTSEETRNFAYAASHDLQEPLRTVLNYVDFLEQDFGSVLGESGQTFLRQISAAAKHCRELTRAMLGYSRLGIERHLQWIDSGAELEDVLRSMEFMVRDAEATVTVSGPLPRIWGDPALLRVLWGNLLGNALKFRNGPAHVEIGAEESPQQWAFSVRDSGIGIDSRYKSQIFQMFRRLSADRVGVGIGLASCKKAAELLGGSIDVTSELGQWSCFTFTVGKSNEEAAAGGGSRPGCGSDPKSTPDDAVSLRFGGGDGRRGSAHLLAKHGILLGPA